MALLSHPVYQSLYERICASWAGLPDKPEETPETTLRTLCHAAAGNPMSAEQAAQAELPVMDEKSFAWLEMLVELRFTGMPLAYITGRQSFLGLTMIASPQAMIPRKETEILGRLAVDTAHMIAADRSSLTAVDLCTGAGNIALAVAAYEPQCQVWGIDITTDAVELANRNAEFMHLQSRAKFLQGDLFSAVDNSNFHNGVDLVTCNPPYISSAHIDRLPDEIKLHEPRPAFDGGPFGIHVVMRLVREAKRFLKPGSWLCFEIGLGQGKNATNLLNRDPDYGDIETFLDTSGAVRALRARFLTAQ